ncbi:hypothetical protein CR205_07950 [Alteribacter lacisalsi]|uniref:DUF4227 family protein n=1 Tax=Alteribacter lacisalsi TaxID=2045244 RepID=A0A2W0HXL6_9BACI|nr:YqzK family protein [Alteribacter lacisalsi]PYZ98508.1 hypothetical protein CR205_07950 [Alteribacter lacisalsi]
MVKTAKVMVDTLFVFVLFMGCTLFFYYGILWVSDAYSDYHRYDEPEGQAVRVIQPVQGETVLSTMTERLRLFYLNGE